MAIDIEASNVDLDQEEKTEYEMLKLVFFYVLYYEY